MQKDEAFCAWWNPRHDWDFTGSGAYEKRFRSAFNAGWDAAKGKKMKIVGLVVDYGDGSAGIRWFTPEDAEVVLDEDYPQWEAYVANEGTAATTITVPDGVTLEDLGIKLSKL